MPKTYYFDLDLDPTEKSYNAKDKMFDRWEPKCYK